MELAPETQEFGAAKLRAALDSSPLWRAGKVEDTINLWGHVLTDLDNDLIRAVGVTPANVPEAWISDAISNDLMAQGVELEELHIDRGDLNSKLVRQRKPDLAIYGQAWPVRNRGGREE